jgi:invasion protein IalB
MALVSLTVACVKPVQEENDLNVQSRHGAWSVICGEAQTNCLAYLPVEDESGAKVLHISADLLPSHPQAAAGFMINIPARLLARGRPDLPINKAAGLVLSVDQKSAQRFPIKDCTPAYCTVNAGVTRGFLRVLETGKTAKVSLLFSGRERRTEHFFIPLSGLSEALKAAS